MLYRSRSLQWVQGARAGLDVGARRQGGRVEGARWRLCTGRWHSQNLLLQQAASWRAVM